LRRFQACAAISSFDALALLDETATFGFATEFSPAVFFSCSSHASRALFWRMRFFCDFDSPIIDISTHS